MSEHAREVTIRQAAASDRDGIVALCLEAFDEFDAAGAAAILDDPRFGTDAFWVGDDGERVVACLGLLSMDLCVGEVAVPTGQPEYIAVAEAYRRRGLVRQMMALAHERSDGRGDVLQLIGGIPYYYRRFGYGWGPEMPSAWRLRRNTVPEVDGVTVRAVTSDDVDTIAAIDHDLRQRADVHNLRTPDEWRAMIRLGDAVDGPEFWALERAGAVVGYAACHLDADGHARLSDVTTTTLDDVTAIVRHALEAGQRDVTILGRPRTVLEPWLRNRGVLAAEKIYAWYARVADPVAFLDRLRPVMTARLQAGPLATFRGDVRISTYVDGAVLHVEDGAVTGVSRAEPDADPGPDVAGIAPDMLAAVTLGGSRPSELEDRFPDVRLRHHAGLFDELFPPQVNHVNLWF